ncbi:MAG: hypothetical protein H0X73_05290 [Chthoniobacterales bacterium]|nr:hypothetical protein [Chthoniobacterales bacterium]
MEPSFVTNLNHVILYSRNRADETSIQSELLAANRSGLTPPIRIDFITAMKLCLLLLGVLFVTTSTSVPFGAPQKADEYRQLKEATPLPMVLDPAFEFRKTKLLFIGDAPPRARRGGEFTGGNIRDESVGFEPAYRLFGAITDLDRRLRFGHYFDFFWKAKRDAVVSVRLEYRQQNLRGFVQAREVVYPRARGSHKTEFQVVGEDFLNDGRITSWRCLLIENGRIVAEDKSFLWR